MVVLGPRRKAQKAQRTIETGAAAREPWTSGSPSPSASVFVNVKAEKSLRHVGPAFKPAGPSYSDL